MSYVWDAFISYRRVPLVSEWTHKVFVPTLRNWLPEYHLPSPRLFLDVDEDPSLAGIPVGAPWSPVLQEALQKSRCLIAIFSAQYFESDWCLTEFQTMLARQAQAKTELIIPVRFADGDFYSEEARSLQLIDFEPYSWYRRPTQASKKFVTEVKNVSRILHDQLSAAPQWNVGWQVRAPQKPNEHHVPRPSF